MSTQAADVARVKWNESEIIVNEPEKRILIFTNPVNPYRLGGSWFPRECRH